MKTTVPAFGLIAAGLTLGASAPPPASGLTIAGIALVALGWALFVLPRLVTR